MTEQEDKEYEVLYSLIWDAHNCNRNLCRGRDCIHCNVRRVQQAGYRKADIVRNELLDLYHKALREVELLKSRDIAKKILGGLLAMANNGVYQGKLTGKEIKLFFEQQYGVRDDD